MIPLIPRHRTQSLAVMALAAAALLGRDVAAADAAAAPASDAVAATQRAEDATPEEKLLEEFAPEDVAPRSGRAGPADIVPPARRGSAAGAAAGSAAGATAKAGRAAAMVARPDPGDVLARLLPPRSDTPAAWQGGLEPLHFCGEPRLLPTCVPPPPCHPALPPHPFDLVGMPGAPTCGPIYRGPCAPRTGSRDDGPHPRIHRVHDRLFDWFYAPRTPILP
jgi:hypothetical protein